MYCIFTYYPTTDDFAVAQAYVKLCLVYIWGFPDGSDDKESASNVGDPGSVPGLEWSPGKGNGNPFQYSHLKNPRDRGAWQATVHGVTKSQTQLSTVYICYIKVKIKNYEYADTWRPKQGVEREYYRRASI